MTPLLLLPGMMCDARLFAPQIGALSADRPILCCPIGHADTIEALAKSILRYAPPRFALAGLSMGGIVAMEIVRLATDRVEKLALMDTNPRAEADTIKALRGPQMQAVRDGKLREIMRDEMKPNYLADGPNRQEILDLCMDMADDLGPQVFLNQSMALMGRRDQQDTLAAYAGPAMVLTGEADIPCPMDRHDLMHALLKNSRLEVILGAGHLPVLEQPEKTTAALRRWLEDT